MMTRSGITVDLDVISFDSSKGLSSTNVPIQVDYIAINITHC